MGLPATATIQTMSNEKYDLYKTLHSEYLSRFIELHNYHQAFLDEPTFNGGAKVRKAITAIIKLEKEMRKISVSVSSERTQNIIDGHKSAKRERARIKALPKKRGRPKVNPPRIRNTVKGRPPKKGKTNDINKTD